MTDTPSSPAGPLTSRRSGLCGTVVAAAGAALLATIALLGVQLHGISSRRAGAPAASAPRWLTVPDARAAFHMWKNAGVRGQALVVLSGRWASVLVNSVPSSVLREPGSSGNVPGGEPFITVDTAVLALALSGIARNADVVMPRDRFLERREAVRRHKDFEPGDGWFSLPFEGFERRFYAFPGAPVVPERVLVLVEPSFFGADSRDLPAWLAQRRLTPSQVVIALDDPTSTDGQRSAARELADRVAATAWAATRP
jgi:hypothetical protein